MKRFFIYFLLLIFIAACGGPSAPEKNGATAKGGVEYGGVFRVNEVADFRSLYPLNITEVTAHRITNQIYEGLVRFQQETLDVVPAIAEKWEVNETATSYIFHLNKGIRFHDDPCFAEGKGREVTAQDFVYCFQRLCTASPDNQMFWLFKDKVVGAKEYYASTVSGSPLAEGVSGIKALDDHTLQIDLQFPFAGFLSILGQPGCWVFPQEAYEKYGIDMRVSCVGTGPFRMKMMKENEAVVLDRNPNYWRQDEHGNQMPYLDAIKFSFVKEKKAELLQFRKGQLDMVFTLPIEMIGDVMSELKDAKKGGNRDFETQVISAFGVQYYAFQHESETFGDKRVRQAFNYAIDRKAIMNFTLQGEGEEGIYGIVPPAFSKYDFDSVIGYQFDGEKARALLAEAGYPDGKGFPTLDLSLNSGGTNYELVAEVIKTMLKETLNINVNLDVVTTAQHLDNAETGKSLFWRDAWLADYPDPENFLNLLYGKNVPAQLDEKSYVNSVRYRSTEFDSIFELAVREVDSEARYRLYRMADQVALDDAAIMPIYYEEFTRLLHGYVKNFPQNGMEYRDMSEVYFKHAEKKDGLAQR